MAFDPDKFLSEIEQPQQQAFNPDQFLAEIEQPAQQEQGPTQAEAALIGAQRGLTLGARPAVAGASAALGAGFSKLFEEGKGFGEAIEAGKQAFSEARKEAIEEEEEAAAKFPVTTAATQLGGSIATAPLTPARGLMGAAKVGAIAGAGEAVGRAETLGEAAESIGLGAGLGLGAGVVLKGVGAAGKRTAALARKAIPKKTLTKIASAGTGIDEQKIAKFAKDTDEINKLIKKVGGDFQEATDVAKRKMSSQIAQFRQEQGKIIENALKDVKDVAASTKPMKDALLNVRKRLDIDTEADQIQFIDEMLETLAKKGDVTTLAEVNKLKQFFGARASFRKNGQFFDPGKQAQKAARGARAAAKNILDSVDELKDANNKLFRLHNLEAKINKSLVKEGTPASAFLQAGAGVNQRNKNALKALGDIIGEDILGEAEKLSTAKAFDFASLLPGGGAEKTGFFAARAGTTGGVIGAGLAAAMGEDPIKGGIIGAALTSPAALKAFINSQNITRKTLKEVGKALASPKVKAVLVREAARQGISANRVRKRIRNSIKNAGK